MKALTFAACVGLVASLPAAAQEITAKVPASKVCFGCHQVKSKIIGPAFADVASRYAGDKGAAQRLVQRIVKGTDATGGTVWSGNADPKGVPMPANKISEGDARTVVDWILSLK